MSSCKLIDQKTEISRVIFQLSLFGLIGDLKTNVQAASHWARPWPDASGSGRDSPTHPEAYGLRVSDDI